MTANTQALQRLLDAVEAGITITADMTEAALGDDWDLIYNYILDANSGSLDAAKALHEALLPERSCAITFGGEYGATVTFPPTWDDLHLTVSNLIPARAWLIAIIRAMLAEGE